MTGVACDTASLLQPVRAPPLTSQRRHRRRRRRRRRWMRRRRWLWRGRWRRRRWRRWRAQALIAIAARTAPVGTTSMLADLLDLRRAPGGALLLRDAVGEAPWAWHIFITRARTRRARVRIAMFKFANKVRAGLHAKPPPFATVPGSKGKHTVMSLLLPLTGSRGKRPNRWPLKGSL